MKNLNIFETFNGISIALKIFMFIETRVVKIAWREVPVVKGVGTKRLGRKKLGRVKTKIETDARSGSVGVGQFELETR